MEQLDPNSASPHEQSLLCTCQHMLLSCLILLSWLQTCTLHPERGYLVARTATDAFTPPCITGSCAALLFRGSPIPQNRTIWQPQMYPASSYPAEPPAPFQTGDIESWGIFLSLKDVSPPTKGQADISSPPIHPKKLFCKTLITSSTVKLTFVR